jgi:uncharacterized repeat protein (TIGR01451 family)
MRAVSAWPIVCCAVILLGASSPAVAETGAAIYIAGDETHYVDVFLASSAYIDHYNINFTAYDGFALGDVNGDGVEELVAAGDETGSVEVYAEGGILLSAFNGSFTPGDALAVGDVDGDGFAEILIAGDESGNVDIFRMNGDPVMSFLGHFTPGDRFAVGNVFPVTPFDEILIAGDESGNIDIFNHVGTPLWSFNGSFTANDGFAVGDLDGDGDDEIVIGGDEGHAIDMFDGYGNSLGSFDGHFTIGDGLAVGDLIAGNGSGEIVVAGDETGTIEVFLPSGGAPVRVFNGHFTANDALAVNRRSYPDRDGDGLFDHWETNGVDLNGDGIVDLDLPGMGADPDHKDLYLELDWMIGFEPRQWNIEAVKEAFALAPMNAGGSFNPDGQPGINLWVDTGGLTDPDGHEDGAGWHTCNDGIDNGGDGLTDGGDPDCLVGDDLGGGNAMLASDIPRLDQSFYDAKAANFDGLRRSMVFRYAIAARGSPSFNSGGWGELGGNDFVEYNHDGGTVMHEFGHNLGLHHGGLGSSHNCKPNYVSVMNYDLQGGITQLGGSRFIRILDYSPPRFPGGRGVAPLPYLNEIHLDEAIVLDPSDPVNYFVFVNGQGTKIQFPLNHCVPWSSGLLCDDHDIEVQIDIAGENGAPRDCLNGYNTFSTSGADDWSVISLRFRQFGDSADGAVNPPDHNDMTSDELLVVWREINSTDMAVTKADSDDPVAAGDLLTYTIRIDNLGPNPASEVWVVEYLPDGVTYQSATIDCDQDGGTVTCRPPMLLAGDHSSFDLVVLVAPDLVYNAGGPVTISNDARSDNQIGDDLDPSNDEASEDTQVVAVADLEITAFGPVGAPPEVLIGETVAVELSKTIVNNGLSSPMDVLVTPSAVAPPGSQLVAPSPFVETAVAVGTPRVVTESFQLTCGQPGLQSFTFGDHIEPNNSEDTDPDLTNNDARHVLAVECVVPVAINIHPKSYPNPINLHAGVPLAVLTTTAGEYGLPLDFDATAILPLTVRFGLAGVVWPETGGAFEYHNQGHPEDSYELDEKTRDRDIDMVLHFLAAESGIAVGDLEACTKGQFTAGSGGVYKFFGCDEITVVP